VRAALRAEKDPGSGARRQSQVRFWGFLHNEDRPDSYLAGICRGVECHEQAECSSVYEKKSIACSCPGESGHA
jgi:hypothetical protein